MVKKELMNSRQFKGAIARQNKTGKAEFTTVPLTWCVRFDLSPTELLTYCAIRDRTIGYEEHAYTGSIKGLCAILNVSLPTARAALEKLEKKGFIYKEIRQRMRSDGLRSWVAYISYDITPKDGQKTEDLLSRNSMLNEQRKKGYRI